jgi:hypothetical protein
MTANADIRAIEEEIREILADGELTIHERNAKLGEFLQRRREIFRRCRELLKEYAPKMRGRSQSEADAVLKDFLASPEWAMVSEILFVGFLYGLYQRDSPIRGFPLPSLPAFIVAPVYRPRF